MVTLGINSSGQIVEDMSIDVHINETLPLIQLVIPRPGVNILAWNHKLFPKGIFQDEKLFPRIYFPNLIIALHL